MQENNVSACTLHFLYFGCCEQSKKIVLGTQAVALKDNLGLYNERMCKHAAAMYAGLRACP